ncbi:MAG: GldG family protein [Nitrospinae bacterium]|nr:GldG family protein [Nitrospinota bacterium]
MEKMSETNQKSKKFKYGANSLVSVIAVIAIIVFIELISFSNAKQFDLTKNKKYTLSNQTVKVLNQLKSKVKAYAFLTQSNTLKLEYQERLNLYKTQNSNFEFEFIDLNKKPLIAEKYNVAFNGETVFEYEGKQQHIRDITEEAITNALVKLTNNKQKTIYFTTGHGEYNLDGKDANGLSAFKKYIGNEGYQTKPIQLFSVPNLPEDMKALVVAGPEKDFFVREINYIKKFMANGGPVFFLLRHDKSERIHEMLLTLGINTGKNLVVDKLSKMLGGDYFTPIIGAFGKHAITENFDVSLQFGMSRTVTKTKTPPSETDVTELCFTSNNAWAETDLKRLKEKNEAAIDENDIKGPVSLAVAATIKSPAKLFNIEEKNAEKDLNSRVIVIGNPDFISNAMLGVAGNLNFSLNIINWILEDEQLISINRVTEGKPETIVLSSTDALFVMAISLFLIPLLSIVLGIKIYITRKNMS